MTPQVPGSSSPTTVPSPQSRPLSSLQPWGVLEGSPPSSVCPQGCFSTFGRTLQKYISVPGTCSLAVLGIEVPSGAGGDRADRKGQGRRQVTSHGLSFCWEGALWVKGPTNGLRLDPPKPLAVTIIPRKQVHIQRILSQGIKPTSRCR